MSARSGIVKAFAEKISADFTGSGEYLTNIYGSVTNLVKHFDDIQNFPYISITPGPETREYQASEQIWAFLTVYVRVFVSDPNDAQGELETIISDIENFIDNNRRLPYNIKTSAGDNSREIIDCEVVSISTDEGLLNPFAFGEVVLTVRYEKHRQF
jgi:hypothetical protein